MGSLGCWVVWYYNSPIIFISNHSFGIYLLFPCLHIEWRLRGKVNFHVICHCVGGLEVDSAQKCDGMSIHLGKLCLRCLSPASSVKEKCKNITGCKSGVKKPQNSGARLPAPSDIFRKWRVRQIICLWDIVLSLWKELCKDQRNGRVRLREMIEFSCWPFMSWVLSFELMSSVSLGQWNIETRTIYCFPCRFHKSLSHILSSGRNHCRCKRLGKRWKSWGKMQGRLLASKLGRGSWSSG